MSHERRCWFLSTLFLLSCSSARSSPLTPPSSATNTGGTRSSASEGNAGGSSGHGGSAAGGNGGAQPSGAGGGAIAGGTGSGGIGTAEPAVIDSGIVSGTGDAPMDVRPGTTGETGPSSQDAAMVEKFSFFVTSMEAMRKLSGSEKGFGGDLRFGKADGLSGADEICRRIAESSMVGAGAKPWRAFLSVVSGPGDLPVNAIDRVGNGPWYDRLGRLVAMTKADLVMNRPRGAQPIIINDLPNEHGVLNSRAPIDSRVDNSHTLTGSKADGTLSSMRKADTCQDWTSSVGPSGRPVYGVSWPRMAGESWIGAGSEGGCAPGYNLIGMWPATESQSVGSNGGYGGIYCLSMTP